MTAPYFGCEHTLPVRRRTESFRRDGHTWTRAEIYCGQCGLLYSRTEWLDDATR